MSVRGIEIALGDRKLQGELRLALICIGDNGGRVLPESVARWANVTMERADILIGQLLQLGYIEATGPGGDRINLEMYEDSGGCSTPSRNPGWPISQDRRIAIFERDEWQCHYCGIHDSLTLDHVVPQVAGGGHDEDNLVACCKSCNSAKGTKSYDEFMASRARVDG